MFHRPFGEQIHQGLIRPKRTGSSQVTYTTPHGYVGRAPVREKDLHLGKCGQSKSPAWSDQTNTGHQLPTRNISRQQEVSISTFIQAQTPSSQKEQSTREPTAANLQETVETNPNKTETKPAPHRRQRRAPSRKALGRLSVNSRQI